MRRLQSFDRKSKWQLLIVAGCVFLIYLFSNPSPMSHFDYTFRIAGEMLQGRLGMMDQPPSWLNEMVYFEDRYYSVFPLGSVLCLIPFALLKSTHIIDSFPTGFIAAFIAATSASFFFLLSASSDVSLLRRLILTLLPVLGTWMWCNLAFAGAWQLALGFAVLGQVGALYYTLVNYRPFLAGVFFAIAFGNRTEVLLTVPIFLYFLGKKEQDASAAAVVKFISVPIALGILTMVYNYVRFHSVLDFGYMRIPQVAHEDLYKRGLFSFYAVPANARVMLWQGWRLLDHAPYLVPQGHGGSIFLSSPFVILLFRKSPAHAPRVIASWIAIVVLTVVLWFHGNPGGWQFSYRYAMILLPWIFLILLDNGPTRSSVLEITLFVVSVAINAYAIYLFLWTSQIQP